MLNIGIIGADNFHALAFARLANLPVEQGGSGLPVNVTMLWGETQSRARFVASETGIPQIVETPSEMLGKVDAVMIVLRHGGQHHAAALPFLKAGVPVWVDKPFTIDINQAKELIALAQKGKTILAGGSTCKYCEDVLLLRDKFRKLSLEGAVLSAGFNFPAEIDSPYGGLYFYGGHAVEILITVFGPDILSVKADVTAGNVIAVFKYQAFAVCVNFAEVSDFYAMLYSAKEVVVQPIDISGIYRQGFIAFVKALQTNQIQEPYETLLRPVRILNALVSAVTTETEVFVPSPW